MECMTDRLLNDTEIITELRKENKQLKSYLRGIIKTLQNNVEVPATAVNEPSDDKIIVTELSKWNSKYIRFQTVARASTKEID